ncbi:hypothetical protein L6060_001521 [Enterococcus faecalis]|uniref:hypothetical protein n=1 Tax=Enterococcus TaxID=1350 RepID=UPI000813AC1E|nr:hypothetical protein [Enterococcus faecalis]EGO8565703.1 hypothetical protein [Enterococcus faecalis]EIT2647780.1 hypothetical protein [Enterococcus faecalis]EIV0114930.1 hypothetical protein [Enterococcus faecalis]EIW4236419.1 hypothetical protein [Enterococcus faecalis]EJC3733288.1 hypothetical protein [Enterococcus faecalis]
MSISFEKLRIALKSVGVPVTRDKAEKGTDYPYIVYSNVSQGKKMASSKVHRRMPYYQISFYTTGTEKDLIALENALEEAGIPYTDFVGIQGDENDDTVTNFYTYVRCIEDGK